MQNAKTDTGSSWSGPAFAIVALVVGLRLAFLGFNQTDLFTDEVQYWLWGQNLDFGYYSKPPLIGWLIGGVTTMAGSDAPFWVRMPGAVLHGITALALAATAAQLWGRSAAIWTAALYITLPFVALGSLLISTDTVMAPFYAGGIYFYLQSVQSKRPSAALLTGLCIGAAFMAKYAAVYLLLGILLAAFFMRLGRIGWRNGALILLGFGVVIAPNIWWNLANDLTTASHTMDNVGWVRKGINADIASMLEFIASQFAVFGPVTMVALLVAYFQAKRGSLEVLLIILSLPPLIVVSLQALLDKAYANWAIAAYFAGILLTVSVLNNRWRWIAMAVNLVFAITLPLLTVLAPAPERGGAPLLKRYLGRTALSESILQLAQDRGTPIYAESRDILSDLFYTGRDTGVPIYAAQPKGRAASYYEQTYPLPDTLSGPIVALINGDPPVCEGQTAEPLEGLDLRGHWADKPLNAYLIGAECLR